MKILHTADWHLGKKLDFYSRLAEQKEVLDEIIQIADREQVDVVIVAGDLYDTFNPPTEASDLLYRTLKKLAKNGSVPVVAIGGNHDSPDKINVPDILARENGIILIGYPTDEVPIFSLDNGFSVSKSEVGFIELQLPQFSYPIRILHTAFANEIRLKEAFGEDKQQSLQESLSNKWRNLSDKYCDADGVNLLTTHLYVSKRSSEMPEEPDGEKPLNIGNADVVYSEVIPQAVQYAALGHIHRYQDMGTFQPVLYSGSPLSYSFSEAGQQKYVAIVSIEPNQDVQIERIPLKSGRPLKRVAMNGVDAAVEWLQENEDALVELTLTTEKFLTADERRRLRNAHEGIIHLIPKVTDEGVRNDLAISVNLDQDMTSIFKEYFKSEKNQEPNDEILDLFKEILND